MTLKTNILLNKAFIVFIVFILILSCIHFSFGINNTIINDPNDSFKNDGIIILDHHNITTASNQVTYVSLYGHDTQNGSDWHHSISSIGKAINITKENGTILLDGGVYYVSNHISKSVKFKGVDRHTVLKNSGTTSFVVGEDVYISFEDITFRDGISEFGGAIYNEGHLRCVNCLFENCSARFGGVIFNYGDLGVANCVFKENRADQGGVIYNEGNVKITSSYFKKNSAGTGAVIYLNSIKHTLIQFCELQNNTANKGNIIYVQENLQNPDIIFDSNHFTFNTNNFIGRIPNSNQLNLSKRVKINLNPTKKLYGYHFDIHGTIFAELHPKLNIPLTGVPIQIFIDNHYIGTITSDEEGNIDLRDVDIPLDPGIHTLKAIFAGNNYIDYHVVTTQLEVVDWLNHFHREHNTSIIPPNQYPPLIQHPLIQNNTPCNNITTPDIKGIEEELKMCYSIILCLSGILGAFLTLILIILARNRRRKYYV